MGIRPAENGTRPGRLLTRRSLRQSERFARKTVPNRTRPVMIAITGLIHEEDESHGDWRSVPPAGPGRSAPLRYKTFESLFFALNHDYAGVGDFPTPGRASLVATDERICACKAAL